MKNKLPGSQRGADECPCHKTIRKQQGNRTLRGHAEMNLFQWKRQWKEAMRGEIPVLKRDHRGTINPNLFRPKNQWTRYPAYRNHCRAQFTSEESCLESPDKKFYFGMVWLFTTAFVVFYFSMVQSIWSVVCFAKTVEPCKKAWIWFTLSRTECQNVDKTEKVQRHRLFLYWT